MVNTAAASWDADVRMWSPCEGEAHDGSVAQLTPRLRKRIEHDFPPGSAEYVQSYLEGLSENDYGGQGGERIQAALVLASRGRRDRFESMVQLLRMDWRDVLMAGGIGCDDWRVVLDRELGFSGE
jgi:hypothetical protein